MLLVRCETLGTDALIWPSDVAGIVNTEQGILVRYRCLCGALAEMLTGSRSVIRVSVHLDLVA